MISKQFYIAEETVKYCSYCKEPLKEGDSYIVVDEQYYHYDDVDLFNNCYFPEDEDE